MRNSRDQWRVDSTKARSATVREPHIITLERERVAEPVNFIERETLTFEDGKLQSYEYAEVR